MAPGKLCVLLLALVAYSLCAPATPSDVSIVGGHNVTIEQVPYMASLQTFLMKRQDWAHICGASIISERHILTAAHCISPQSTYRIVVGSVYTKKGKIYEIESITTHPKYHKVTFDFDICLIKLSKPLQFGPTVALIKLMEFPKIPKGTLFNVTGWGYTSDNGTVSPSLLEVSVPLIQRKACQREYLPFMRQITLRMLCAGTNGKDSCQGDSGGPLTLDGVQVGVVSFGVGCGSGMPGVYTKVASFKSWLQEHME